MIESALLQFSNILEVAGLCDSAGDVYGKQENIAAECRARGQLFLATMPLRHMFLCESCNSKTAEALFHFEDPAQPADSNDDSQESFLSSKHLHLVVHRSTLHGICAHKQPLPPQVSRFFSRIT